MAPLSIIMPSGGKKLCFINVSKLDEVNACIKLYPSYVHGEPVGEVSEQEIPPYSLTNTALHQCQTDDLKQNFLNKLNIKPVK